jgi:hypothetical protein
LCFISISPFANLLEIYCFVDRAYANAQTTGRRRGRSSNDTDVYAEARKRDAQWSMYYGWSRQPQRWFGSDSKKLESPGQRMGTLTFLVRFGGLRLDRH